MRLSSPRRAGVAAISLAIIASLALTILPGHTSLVLPRVRAPRLLASVIDTLDTPQPLSGRVSVTVNVRPRRGIAFAQAREYRIWRSSAGVRIAQILPDSERLFVANRSGAWWWDSETMSATRLDAAELSGEAFDFAPALVGDPLAFARAVLGAVQRRSEISVDGTAVIAGRPAYRLTVRSTLRRSGVRKVALWVEARTRFPLRIQLWTRRGGSPAIDVAFTRISFTAVDAGLFDFSPPHGTDVERLDLIRGRRPDTLFDQTQTFGRGWRTRVAFRVPARLTDRAEQLFPLVSSFGSVTAVRDRRHSWVLAGFVPLRRLERDIPRLS